jgi:hypothetical protein
MSDDKKPNFEVFTTPVGELVYPWLTRADTRYDPDGVFQTKLLLPFDFAPTQELIARLEGVRTAFIQTLDTDKQASYIPANVYETEKDEEGVETGNVLFRFKLKNHVTPKEGDTFTQTPVLVFAEDGAAVTAPIYGGTMARLKGQIVPYTNAASKAVGVTLRLRSVQVHELVSGGGDGGAFWSDFD